MYKIYNKESETYHSIDVVETHGDITVVFTEDSKCFPIEKTLFLTSDRFKYLYENFSKNIITENESNEIDIHITSFLKDRFKLSDREKEQLEIELKSITESYKKKSIKGYLLSIWSGLFPTSSRP